MALPDLAPAGTAFLTYAELPEILARIRSGRPALLGLVLTTAKKGQLWENHQVLAYAAEMDADAIRIRIYDPNFARQPTGAFLRMTYRRIVRSSFVAGRRASRSPWIGVQIVRSAPGRRDLPVRGVFLMPYASRRPPANVTESDVP